MSRHKSLEVFKFAIYLGVPIALTAFVVYSPSNLRAIINNRAYVQYPPEGARPPASFDELQAAVRKQRGGR